MYGEGTNENMIAYSFLDVGEYTASNTKLGWITTGISDLAYLSGIKQLKFEVSVLIIDVFDTAGNEIVEYKHLQSPLEHTLKTISNSRSWNIHNKEAIKMLLNAQSGSSFESGFFRLNKLEWNIKLYPNGRIESGFEDGDVLIQMQLKEMIKPMIALSFMYSIHIKETETWFCNIAHFRHSDDDYYGLRSGWTLSHLALDRIRSVEILTIKVEIKVLDVYSEGSTLLTQAY